VRERHEKGSRVRIVKLLAEITGNLAEAEHGWEEAVRRGKVIGTHTL